MLTSLWRSLQNRLVLISIGACLAVLGATGGIATYRLRYDLFVRTNRWHEMTVMVFQQDVATYREFYPEAEAIQRAIDKYTRSDRWFKVTTPAGEVVATSLNFASQPEVLITPPAVPTLMRDREFYFILCRQPLDPNRLNGLKVTTVTDVTDSYEVYLAFLRTLTLSGISTAALIAYLGSLLIRRSLQPLHSVSRLSATLSPQTLPEARLILEKAPTEVAQLAESFNGIGIPLDQQSRIFERFHSVSTSRSRQQGGIGLGLTIAKALVEKNMRGQIRVESTPGKGSTFTVTLPLQPYAGFGLETRG